MKIRDDILKAMQSGETTLMVMADFSKAFDTLDHRIALKKLFDFGFSKESLKWIHNYLSKRKQYVLLNDLKSDLLTTNYGVPQGSILGPVLFNLYVSDLQQICSNNTKTAQYADDTTIYKHSKVKDLDQCIEDMNLTLDKLHEWSESTNLALNHEKTKAMLISTQQLTKYHKLDIKDIPLHIQQKSIKLTTNHKLLGTNLQNNLKWDQQVYNTAKSCYGTLSILRKMKHLAPPHIKKNIVQALIISKLNYSSEVLHPLPSQLLTKLQKIQNTCASFVTNRYCKETDILKLGWLPLKELFQFNILKMAHKALYSPNWPSYLRLTLHSTKRQLRSSSETMLQIPREKNTFQDTASKLFSKLPTTVRSTTSKGSFLQSCRILLESEARARLN